jgi:hypothetical protein
VTKRRTGRFVLEVIFLGAVAAAVTLAHFQTAAIVACMALAWVVVALLEWTAWIDEPHYGRGLPPRYYVPQVALPPQRPVEQRVQRVEEYPAAATAVVEERTWFSSAEEWGTTLHDWPVLGTPSVGEETEVVEVAELEEAMAAEPTEIAKPLPAEPLPATAAAAAAAGIAPAVEPPAVEDDHEREHGLLEHTVVAGLGAAAVETAAPVHPKPEPTVEPEPEPEPVPLPELAVPAVVSGTAIHHLDPFSGFTRRGLFRRREQAAAVEVEDGPPSGRPLPSRVPGGTPVR